MLDQLRGEHRAERVIGKAVQIADGVADLDVLKALRAAVLNHRRVDVDARGLDARLAQQVEELASSAADV